ncbi:MAG: hypothetical protein II781_04705 [Clostridia bacterium]|nr:hypothetical protein [Clostridia bacterium]
MKWVKPVLSITMQNFRKWKQDCRVWIAFGIVLILIHSVTKGLSGICAYTGVKSSPWIFPFLYAPYYNKLLFFFPLVLIFSNAPFIDRNQLYVLIRSGRVPWCLGQMLYIVLASALYFLFILLFSVVLNLDCMTFTGEWGKLLNTLANTSLEADFQLGFDPIKNVVDLFSPGNAVWFTFLHSWVSGILLGFLVFLFNLKIKGGGTFFASLLLVFSAIAAKQPRLLKFSPVSWSTLNALHLKANDGLPHYGYVTLIYGILLLVLAGIILFSVKRTAFDRESVR